MLPLSTRLLRLALVIVVAEVAAAAQQPAPGSLQGVVVKRDTSDTLPNVTVELRAASAAAGQSIAVTTTDSRGQFLFPAVPPGSYRLLARRPGYVNAEYGQPRPGAPGLDVTVEAGQQTAGVRLSMTPGGVISGRVTGRGQPRALAAVVALTSTYYDGNRTMVPVLSARTDDLGAYHLFWLPPGEYYIAAVVLDGENNNLLTTGLFVNPESGSNSFLALRNVFAPVLQRAIGSGAAANEMHVPIYYPGTPDWRGAQRVEVQPGAEIRNVDVEAPPQPTRRVQGTLTGALPLKDAEGMPVPLLVSLAMLDAPFPVFNQSNQILIDVEPGQPFEFPAVAPGMYALYSSQPGGNGTRVNIDLRSQDLVGINLVLNQRFTVSGRIVVEPDSAAAIEAPLTDFAVTLRADPPLPSMTSTTAATLADGSFKIVSLGGNDRALRAGLYRVSVAPILLPPTQLPGLPPAVPQRLRNVYVKSIRLGDKDVLNDGLHLQAQPEEELIVVIGANPGALSGSVVDEQQQPIATASVVLIPEGGLRFRVNHRFTSTDAAGRFRVETVPPGDYKLFAWKEVERGQWQDPDFVRNFEGAGTPVRVAEGTRHEAIVVSAIPVRR